MYFNTYSSASQNEMRYFFRCLNQLLFAKILKCVFIQKNHILPKKLTFPLKTSKSLALCLVELWRHNIGLPLLLKFFKKKFHATPIKKIQMFAINPRDCISLNLISNSFLFGENESRIISWRHGALISEKKWNFLGEIGVLIVPQRFFKTYLSNGVAPKESEGWRVQIDKQKKRLFWPLW